MLDAKIMRGKYTRNFFFLYDFAISFCQESIQDKWQFKKMKWDFIVILF